MGTLLQDIRYGFRTLAKNPGFTIVAILTLALGIGANTALFSVVNGVLLSPLSFPHSDQLATMYERKMGFEQASISYPNFLDWQRNNRSFSSIASYRQDDFTVTGIGQAERVPVEMVSADFFQTLGVKPVIGRLFSQDDDHVGAGPVAILSGGFWKRKFGSAADVVGKQMMMDGRDYTIVGVIPADFDLPVQNFRTYPEKNEVYVPIGQWNAPLFHDRKIGMGMDGIGRIKPGVTLEQAHADMDSVAQALAAEYPDANRGNGITLTPLKKEMVGDIRPLLMILLGAVGFVLLIACVNVANLLLARSTTRAREFAIRAALGATHTRVIRQLLTESILLSLGGAALGVLLAAWGTKAALQLLPAALPRSENVALDGHVLLFTFGVSLLAGLVFGLTPAIKAARSNLQDTLRESGRGNSGTRNRAQMVFVAVEMATALVLLVGAGLMIRSLARIWSVDPGFNPKNVVSFGVTFPPSAHPTATEARNVIRSRHDGLASIPGVKAVSLTGGSLPMQGDSELPFWIDGQPKPATEKDMNWSLFYMVEPDYLKAMGISLRRGRFLTDQDREHGNQVAVIDEEFARTYFPNEDPIGKRFHVDLVNISPEIVGVVGHVKHWGLDTDAQSKIRAQMYLSYIQMPDELIAQGALGGAIVVRTDGDPLAMTGSLREKIQKQNSEAVAYGFEAMETTIANSLAARRFAMTLLTVFAAFAVLLSSIGIYGVISYLVGQRTHEIGVRIALGAQRADVLRLVLGEGVKMAALGVAIGIVAALALTQLMSKMVFGVSTTDPLTFAGVAVLLVGVALFACYIPARRAMRVDPMVALRYE
ncbi:MAG: ABC transporter permease [Candidatus Acidiferrales bacterium]